MFPDRRPATVALLLITGMIATGTLVGAVIVGATSGGATRDLTSVGALAVATRSLPRVWVVRRGDTYTAIVAKTHLTVAQLQQLNPTQDPNACWRTPTMAMSATSSVVMKGPRTLKRSKG